MTRVVVYSKEGCHICERVIAELRKLSNEQVFETSLIDITTDSELYQRYKNLIPVLLIDGKVKLAGEMLTNPNTFRYVLLKTLSSHLTK